MNQQMNKSEKTVTYQPRTFTFEQLLDYISSKCIHVPDSMLEDFTNELMDGFYNRDDVLRNEVVGNGC